METSLTWLGRLIDAPTGTDWRRLGMHKPSSSVEYRVAPAGLIEEMQHG